MKKSLSRFLPGLALLLLAVALFGCGKPFNVKTQPPASTASYTSSATTEHLSVQARAITDEDYLYDTFDANLLLAGILPVRVMLTNSGTETVDLKDARFEVNAAGGTIFKTLNERQAFKRLISYYEISTYNKAGYKESFEAFSAYVLDTRTPLAVGQSRQGIVFVSVPAKAAQASGLTLVISRFDTAKSGNRGRVELKLN